MDEQQQRLERLRARRDALTAGGLDREAGDLDQEIAEAEQRSLTGSADPRTDTRLEGSQARCYVAALMRNPSRIDAAAIRRDALSGTGRALSRLRLAACRTAAPLFAHARVSLPPRRPGRATGRTRRGPARAAPALPRPAGAA